MPQPARPKQPRVAVKALPPPSLPALPDYAELHCRSNFSFLTGASHPEELVERAAELGYTALAITDECSVAGVVRAHEAAKLCKLPLILGSEFTLQGADGVPGCRLVVLARNRNGWGNLCELITRGRLRSEKGQYELFTSDLEPASLPRAGGGLGARRGFRAACGEPAERARHAGRAAHCKWGSNAAHTPEQPATPHPHPNLPPPRGKEQEHRAEAHAPGSLPLAGGGLGWGSNASHTPEQPYPPHSHPNLPPQRGKEQHGLPDCEVLLVPRREDSPHTLLAQAQWLAATFGERAAIAIELLMWADDSLMIERLLEVSEATQLPLAACGDVLMHRRSRKAAQDTLTAIRLKTTVAECGFALARNAEQHLRSRLQLAQLYRPEWLAHSVCIARRCTFSLDELRYEYPQEIVPPGHTATSYLREQTEAGAMRRYAGVVPEPVRAQIERELVLVKDLRYEAFFLTVYDVVQFARRQGILCQGRGSAANSAVCYCLGITEVDPTQTTLLFERFISRERNEPPDIDVDFEHERREEVIQYIYAKYGTQRTALAAALSTYRTRGSLRDVGKALGIDVHLIDTLAKSFHWFDDTAELDRRLQEAGLDPSAPVVRRWMELIGTIRGFPRHLSQHVGGFVIARDKLSRLVPIENAAMENRRVIQWDKDDLESLGLLKVDVLALGMLSALKRSLDFMNAWRGTKWALHDIPREDPATYAMIQRADTIGVFQIESRAQQSMLPRLRPERFYDLVIEVAIVRPGPIKGGMVHPYLRRKQGLESSASPNPALDPALKRTLGVPIFQEQVMQICMIAAGFTGGEADSLRRAMAAWRRKGGVHKFHERIVVGMTARGYSLEFAEAIFKQIQGFGDYGFPESHAYSFAILVYFSSWIKCHEPAIFLTALLNSQPMGFYGPSQLVQDAKRHGVAVRAVDAMVSQWDCTIEPGCGAVCAQSDFVRSEPHPVHPALQPVRPEVSKGQFVHHDPPPFALNPHPVRPEPVEGLRQAQPGPSIRREAYPVLSLPKGQGERGVDPGQALRQAQGERGLLSTGHTSQQAQGERGVSSGQTPRQAQDERGGAQGERSKAQSQPVQPQPAVRLGLRMVAGLSQEAANRLLAARAQAPFSSIEDLSRRAHLDAQDLQRLARADALQALGGHRRQQSWQASGQHLSTALLHEAPIHEQALVLQHAPEGEEILHDYASVGLTLRRHPVALLREKLARRGWKNAAQLATLQDGDLAWACGIVTVRQQPETAKGTIFVTLEDETGSVNVVVWARVREQYRHALLQSRLLAVRGTWQSKDGVNHLVARRLVDATPWLGRLATVSRDFH